jgi:hypothetical protein
MSAEAITIHTVGVENHPCGEMRGNAGCRGEGYMYVERPALERLESRGEGEGKRG